MKTISTFFKNHSTALIFILFYVALLAPFSLIYIFFMPDERHYVDAAIYMLQHGEYLSPHDPNGGFRFLKPIFTYWAVLVSYVTFGVSQFSSRLPILLTAGFSLWMTYRIALLAFNEKKIANYALIIMGAAPVLHRSTCATLTDFFLLIFLQIMILGVVGLLIKSENRKAFLWAMYFGAGMAVMTKGLPAIAFLAVSLLFLIVNPWKRLKLKEALYIPALLSGIILGGFWFIAVYYIHGGEALGSFYEDQVGIRVAARISMVFQNFLYSMLVVLLILFPMALPGFRSLFYRKNLSEASKNKENKAIFSFIVIWILAMIGMATFVSKFYYRYLIPAIPAIAILFAYFMHLNENRPGLRKMGKAALWVAFILLLLVSFGGMASVYLFDGAAWQIFVLLIFALSAIIFFVKNYNKELFKKSRITFVLMVGIFFALFFLVKPISYPGQGIQITEKLMQNEISGEGSIQFFGKTRIASRIRVASGGEFYLKANKQFEASILPNTQYLIFEDTYLDSLNLENFQIQKLSNVWGDIDPAEVWEARKEGKLQELKEKRSESYYLGIRK